MEKYTTVKILTSTLKKLHMMAAKLSILKGRRLNLNDTIDFIIDLTDKSSLLTEKEENDIAKDREDILNLLKIKIKGAGPEDYVPYDFEDISSY
jgi:hypothetical protein